VQYRVNFIENGVDGSLLGDLVNDPESLKEVGFENEEHVVALQRLHKELETGREAPTASTPTSSGNESKAVPPIPPSPEETSIDFYKMEPQYRRETLAEISQFYINTR
jgi:hypothetical protein